MTTAAIAAYATTVQELYVAYFGRPADPAGLQNFETALLAANAPTTLAGLSAEYGINATITALVNDFGDSGESARLYGTALATNAGQAQQFVAAVFENLFDRAPLQAGLTFWSNALLTGSMTPGEAAMEIALGAAPADAATFNNKIAAAGAFTGDLIAIGTDVYAGPVAAAAGRGFLAGIDGSTATGTYQAEAITVIDNLMGISPNSGTGSTSSIAMTLTTSGDAIHLNGTTAASTVSLSGADLATYPSSTYGTVAELAAAHVTSISDTSGNFTLDASGNANSTAFNFGTGVVSGSDAASSTGIHFAGVTTYITSGNGDTVTLSAATQNVTASNDGNTVNLGGLNYTGTLNFTAGSGGTDTVNATVGGNLGGATIDGTSSSVAKIALVLSAAGTETLSTAEYNTITSTTGGSITFTGGTFGTDIIAFANAGTVTAISAVGNYDLSSSGDTIILNNVADQVTGSSSASGGNDAVFLGALTYTGTTSFGSSGSDSIHVTSGGDISGGNVTSSGASVALVLSGSGTEKMNTAEYNLFNAHSITGGTPGGDTIEFSNGGIVTANANVYNYDLSAAGNTITLTSVSDNVTGVADSSDTVNLGTLAYTGTLIFGAGTSNTIEVSGGNIHSAAITFGAATALEFTNTGAATETMSTAQYNAFNSISGGTAANNTIGFTDAAQSVTDNAAAGNYILGAANSTITVENAGSNVDASAGSGNTINIGAITYSGTLTFGSGSDTLGVSSGSDIHGASINFGSAAVGLMFDSSGPVTMTTEQYGAFGSIAGGTATDNTIILTDSGNISDVSGVGNYDLSSLGNGITVNQAGTNVKGATAGGADTVILDSSTYTGSLAFGSHGTDVVDLPGSADISGGAVTSTGATVDLFLAAAATVTMTTAEYTLFYNANASTGISGGTFAGNTVVLSDAGNIEGDNHVGNYDFSTAGNSIFLFQDGANVTGAASGDDQVGLGNLDFAGAIAFGGSGNDTVEVYAKSVSANLSSGTITSSGATVGLEFLNSGVLSEQMNTTEYNLFNNGGGISLSGGATAADTTIVFTDAAHSVTDNANVGNYTLATGDSITVDHVLSNVDASSGGNTVTVPSINYAGTMNFGSTGTDTLYVSSGNISGGTITSTGAIVDLTVNTVVIMSSAQENFFHDESVAITGVGAADDTFMYVEDSTNAINLNGQENVLQVHLIAGHNTVNVSVGATNSNGGQAGFNQSIIEDSTGGNTYNVDNGGATIVSASDDSHYVTINSNSTNVATDNLVLTLSGAAQTGGTENLNGNNNGVSNGVDKILMNNSASVTGFTLADATVLSTAESNLSDLVNVATVPNGAYTFVEDTTQGAGIYEVHFTSGSIDGIQLIGVVHGVTTVNLEGRIT